MTAWMKENRQLLLVGVPLAFLFIITLFYQLGGRYVSTDDAYVRAAKAAISSNIPGQVVEIFVKDNQAVKKGAILFRLDDRPYKIAANNANAHLTAARLQVEGLKATYKQQLAITAEAKHTLDFQQQEYNRQKKLAAAGVASQMELNRAVNNLHSAEQQVAAEEQRLASILANLNNNPEILVENHPLVQQAQAKVDQANLNLAYTVIAAPIDGIVTKVEQLQPGDIIKPGMPVFALISNRDIWIEANFKETDITYMQPGQQVSIDIDTYPNRSFKGVVASISPGTGPTFSLLPPEDATGNWVKVIQRVPVRITIKNPPAMMLNAGLSANVTVDTKHRRLFS